jgi:hypothetical protein
MYTVRRMRLGLGKPGPDFLFAAKCFFDDFRLHLDEIGFSILNRVKNFVCGIPTRGCGGVTPDWRVLA